MVKAWHVWNSDEWSMQIHAETVSKAKMAARRVWPELDCEFISLRVCRFKALDDKPFTLEAMIPYSYDPYTANGEIDEYINFCECPICCPSPSASLPPETAETHDLRR